MKVIVAGAQKTGTKSLAEAFKQFGYNVYDFPQNYEYLGKQWLKILTEGGSVEDFRTMFQGVDAVMDVPCLHYWEEIQKAFPEAKIILTYRENEDDWYRSFMKQNRTIHPLTMSIMRKLSPSFNHWVNYYMTIFQTMMGFKFGMSAFKETSANELAVRMWYRRHNAYVLQAAPKDKLLVYSVKQGWGPLCEFLGEDTPTTPFPHKNKNGSFTEELFEKYKLFRWMKTEFVISASVLTLMSGYLIYNTATQPKEAALLYLPVRLIDSTIRSLGYCKV